MSNDNNKLPAAPVANIEPTPSERFTTAVQREFASTAGENIQLTSFQRKLVQNYFIKIDAVLKEAELKRLSKREEYRDPLPYTWANVNIPKLAIDVISFSSVGLDPMQSNQLSPNPYKNNKSNQYDIGFIIGYRGTEVKARKYGLDVPEAVIVELVYSNDHFVAIKKDKDNPHDSYEFKIVNPFDRGDIIGGFYFHDFGCTPGKNRLKTYTKKDIDKRRPAHAAAEFWGGEKERWETNSQGRREKVTEEVEGWYEEMAFKTVFRAAWNSITIDSEKIDQHYAAVLERESQNRMLDVDKQIADNANGAKIKDAIGFTDDPQASEGAVDFNPQFTANTQEPPDQVTQPVNPEDKQQNSKAPF